MMKNTVFPPDLKDNRTYRGIKIFSILRIVFTWTLLSCLNKQHRNAERAREKMLTWCPPVKLPSYLYLKDLYERHIYLRISLQEIEDAPFMRFDVEDTGTE